MHTNCDAKLLNPSERQFPAISNRSKGDGACILLHNLVPPPYRFTLRIARAPRIMPSVQLVVPLIRLVSEITNAHQNVRDESQEQEDRPDTDSVSTSSSDSPEVKRGALMGAIAFILQTDHPPVFHPKYRSVLMLYTSNRRVFYAQNITVSKVASDSVGPLGSLFHSPGDPWAY